MALTYNWASREQNSGVRAALFVGVLVFERINLKEPRDELAKTYHSDQKNT
jgi:hypothetical protein